MNRYDFLKHCSIWGCVCVKLSQVTGSKERKLPWHHRTLTRAWPFSFLQRCKRTEPVGLCVLGHLQSDSGASFHTPTSAKMCFRQATWSRSKWGTASLCVLEDQWVRNCVLTARSKGKLFLDKDIKDRTNGLTRKFNTMRTKVKAKVLNWDTL